MRRRLFWFPLFAALVTANLHAGEIDFQVIDLGGGMDRYVYTFFGIPLLQHQEVDIQFDATMFSTLSNPQAPNGFNALFEQPGNPMGAPGHLSIVATMDSQPDSGPFTIDFLFTGSGTPGTQTYAINQLDNNDVNITQVLGGGTTQPLAVPEPSTMSIAAAGLVIVVWGGLSGRSRRSRRVTTGVPAGL
jgi:hypothetical protein